MSRARVLPPSASAAAVPAASPIAKHAPDTRAADWPSWVIEAQRPAINRLSMPSGTSIRYGNSLNPRDSGIGGHIEITSPAIWDSIGQPLTPIESSKEEQPSTSSPESI